MLQSIRLYRIWLNNFTFKNDCSSPSFLILCSPSNCLQTARELLIHSFLHSFTRQWLQNSFSHPLSFFPGFTYTPVDTIWALPILINTIPTLAVCYVTTTTMIHALQVALWLVALKGKQSGQKVIQHSLLYPWAWYKYELLKTYWTQH